MHIHFLGTGGYHPNERRHTACVMLPEAGVVFDAGTGLFRAAERAQTERLDIFLSHAHLDHISGLTYLLAPLATGNLKQVAVHSAPQYLAAVREHLFAQPIFPVLPAIDFIPLADRVAVGQGGTVTHCPLTHPGGSLGYRIDWPGRSLAYITDTFADGSYLEFVHGVDLLIHECYFPDELAEWAEKTGHSFTSQVAHLARDAGVGRLILVHVDPRRADDDPVGLEAARGIFPETTLAEDRMVVDV
ncbi:MAG: MBL fold metallo-hydrolase [Planctomycetaceae bacterium]